MSASELHVLRVAGNKRRGALIDEVADECGLSRNAASVRLRRLRTEGFLTVPHMRWAGHVKYRVTEQGRRALAQMARRVR